MLEEMTYTVIPIDGSCFAIDQLALPYLQMENLNWDEAKELLRISLMQGFQVVIMATAEDVDETGCDE